MAGSYLPPVVQQLTLNISDFLAKIEEAKAAQDDFAAHSAESNAAMKGEADTLGGSGGPATGFARAGREAEGLDKHLGVMRQLLHGELQTGLEDMSNNLQNIAGELQAVTSGLGGFFSGIGSALGTMGSAFTGPLGVLGSIVGFAKTWAVLVPTLMAAPALLAAIGGAAGGLAGSFTVLSSVIGLFAMGAMKDLSYVTSVSNMAQFDALSAPLQRLYYAYHNLSNEFTIMTQTMGGNSTIIGTLTDMFDTMAVVLQKLGPLMGAAASAVQSGFNVIAASLQGSEFTNFVSWIGAEATPVLTTFAQTFVGLASGWAGLMEDLTPAITLFDNGMVHLTQTFSNWANSPKGRSQVEGFVSYVQKAWPEIEKFWQGLGHIFYEFFSSAAKGAPGMAADLGNLFTTIGNAIPSLVRFGDSVLPKIVMGFSQLAGGFVSGLTSTLGNLFKSLDSIHGPNWREIGEEMGKMTGELIAVLPIIGRVAAGILSIAASVLRIKGAIEIVVGAWLAFNAIVAIGQLITAIAALGGAFAALGGLVGSVFGVIVGLGEVVAGVVAALAAAVGLPVEAVAVGIGLLIAAIVLLATHWSQVTTTIKNLIEGLWTDVSRFVGNVVRAFEALPGEIMHGLASLPSDVGSVLSQIPGIGALFSVGGDIGSLLGLGGHTGAGAGSTATTHRHSQIMVNSQNTVQVAGPVSPEALQQISALLAQHDRQLVMRLQQVRGAYA